MELGWFGGLEGVEEVLELVDEDTVVDTVFDPPATTVVRMTTSDWDGFVEEEATSLALLDCKLDIVFDIDDGTLLDFAVEEGAEETDEIVEAALLVLGL